MEVGRNFKWKSHGDLRRHVGKLFKHLSKYTRRDSENIYTITYSLEENCLINQTPPIFLIFFLILIFRKSFIINFFFLIMGYHIIKIVIFRY